CTAAASASPASRAARRVLCCRIVRASAWSSPSSGRVPLVRFHACPPARAGVAGVDPAAARRPYVARSAAFAARSRKRGGGGRGGRGVLESGRDRPALSARAAALLLGRNRRRLRARRLRPPLARNRA